MKNSDLRKGIQETSKYSAFNSHCSVKNLVLGHKDTYIGLTVFHQKGFITRSKGRRGNAVGTAIFSIL